MYMIDPSIAKYNIKAIVVLYRAEYPEEYQRLKQAIEFSRQALYDPKYATVDAQELKAHNLHIQRGLYEISITLDAMLVKGLSIEELTWWKTKEGGYWFAETFREFALPERI